MLSTWNYGGGASVTIRIEPIFYYSSPVLLFPNDWEKLTRAYEYELEGKRRELAKVRIPVKSKVRVATENRFPNRVPWCARMQAFRCRNRSTKGGKLIPQPGLR